MLPLAVRSGIVLSAGVCIALLACGGKAEDNGATTGDAGAPSGSSSSSTSSSGGTSVDAAPPGPTPGAACPHEGETRCADTCVDLRTDPKNCGACTVTC